MIDYIRWDRVRKTHITATSEVKQGRKISQMQQVRLVMFSSRELEETFDNTQWRRSHTNVISVTLHALIQVL